MTILGPDRYRVVDDDRLWLQRAVQAEATDPQDRMRVAQALANRYMMLRHRNPTLYPTLAEFVRAYAQPVNPRWMIGGDKFERSMSGASAPVKRALTQSAQKRAAHASREVFAVSTIVAVGRALAEGPVDLPAPSTTDYQGPYRPTAGHLVRQSEHGHGANTYYRVRGADQWDGYTVVAIDQPYPGIWVLLGAAALGIAVAMRRK